MQPVSLPAVAPPGSSLQRDWPRFLPRCAAPGTAEPLVRPEETRTAEDEARLDDGNSSGDGFRVILYNDDWHAFDDVIAQLVKATGCTSMRAARIAIEAHSKGRAQCFKGARSRCHDVARVLREIRLQCEVDHD